MILVVILALLVTACGSEPLAEEKAIADNSTGQSLGLHKTTVDGVASYQFLLCQRLRIAEQNDIDKSLTDPLTCYNPLVDVDGQPVVLRAEPTAAASFLDNSKRLAGKSLVVVGGATLVVASIYLGVKSWKWFISVEEYFRHSRVLDGVKSDVTKGWHKVISWFKDGKVISFLATFFVVGDGAFVIAGRIFNFNKFYYHNGQKVLFDWGKGDKLYRENLPYLINGDWRNTKKVPRVHYVLDAIRNDIGCQFSERYRQENPLL